MQKDKIQALAADEKTTAAIQVAVADMFGISVADLLADSRARSVTVPRQIAMYLAKYLTEASLEEIGRNFGGMHRTTVSHSIAKVADRRSIDARMNGAITRLLQTLSLLDLSVQGGTESIAATDRE